MSTPLESDLAFIARQLSFAAKQPDFNYKDVLEKLKRKADPEFSAAIEQMEQLEDPNQCHASMKNLATILCQAKPQPATMGLTINRFVKLKQKLQQDVYQYFYSLRNQFFYSMALILIALSISALYGFVVYPSIEQMEYGNLPDFAKFMVGGGYFLLMWVLAVIFLLLLCLYLASGRMVKKVSHLAIAKGVGWVLRPFAKGLVDSVNRYVLLSYIQLFKLAGNTSQQAVSNALALAGYNNSLRDCFPKRLCQQIESSIVTQTLSQELQYQLDHASEQLTGSLVRVRRFLTLGLQLFIFLVIAILVMALYLPIFQMGSVA